VLATGSRDGTVRIWSLDRKEVIKTLRFAPSDVGQVAFSEDAKLLAHSLPPRVGKHVLLATS